ncbi:mediator of RNA polymerase II transcription subunit 26-like isoform X2 [Electrophorus electricus]|uniref:mediator of RNA polymerase II transcription subunit 26-like isoform X2 n=1 Tax=Electrophorus electricus TaxID=8005 RepID=UPI0015CFB17B|nr:mediator of RNA polymerase II transcription subunit 26-like isoform X2 [Electrophorus electricus]
MAMTTASATTPQQMRDRLLQAIDCQSNIHNMVVVLDVISSLEKYPITKEALEETRLGKLINDLRKRTRNEDLAKRAKKLLRNWQKLIEPQQNEISPKVLSTTASSTVKCSQSLSLPISRAVQAVTDVDKKSALPNSCSQAEKLRPVNHSSGQKPDENLSTLKVSKTSVCGQISAVSSTSEHGGTEAFSGGAVPTSPTSIKPHFSSSELNKQPSTSTVLRTSVLQQYGRRDRAASERGQHKCQSHYTPSTLRTVKQLVATKWPTSLAVSDSENFSALLLNSSIQTHTESLQPMESLPQWENDPHQNGEKTLEQTNNLQNKSKCLVRLQSGLLSEVTNVETEKDAIPSEGRRRKLQLRDYSTSLDGRSTEDTCKGARVKNRKLTFDPFTQQIRSSVVSQSEEQHSSVVDVNESDSFKQSPSTSSLSSLHKTSWKELSQNEIVKYYLNLQNNLLKTSGSQSPGSNFFMTEKHEEDHVRDSSKTCVLVPSITETDLPGICRDITIEDLNRIHNKHWPGVNGCYDSKGNWYGWTQCISLDPYVDGSKLNILPYVCID